MIVSRSSSRTCRQATNDREGTDVALSALDRTRPLGIFFAELTGIELTLHVCLVAPRLFLQIFIKTLTGRKQALNFEPENQVLAIKQALQEKEGIQVDQIKLIHSGKQLADDKTLESYNIAAGATIHMVLQLRGGCGI